MSLNARAIALQGVGYSPRLLALQGLSPSRRVLLRVGSDPGEQVSAADREAQELLMLAMLLATPSAAKKSAEIAGPAAAG